MRMRTMASAFLVGLAAAVLVHVNMQPIVAGGADKKLTEYKNAEGKFKILFPGKPKLETTRGLNNVMVYVFSVEAADWAYTLNYYDSPVALGTDNLPTLLSAEIDGIYKGLAGKKAAQKLIKIQGNQAAEHAGTITKPRDMTVRGRSVIVGDRVYNILVLGSADFVKTDSAKKFLESFQVTK
jgi:hypothetical protein